MNKWSMNSPFLPLKHHSSKQKIFFGRLPMVRNFTQAFVCVKYRKKIMATLMPQILLHGNYWGFPLERTPQKDFNSNVPVLVGIEQILSSPSLSILIEQLRSRKSCRISNSKSCTSLLKATKRFLSNLVWRKTLQTAYISFYCVWILKFTVLTKF